MDPILQNHVNRIAQHLTEGFPEDYLNECGEPMDALDYLQDALDIQYIVDGNRTYLAARVLVAFGGPNIWINTQTGYVEGYWGGEAVEAPFIDNIGIDEALEELWNCY
ncbi:hypothetical protein NB640_12480 [Oxalobacter vibrioformis]|uniref:Uncharacterized protein n=1 Tax=Oxalobacter vibrioformis TaxID=933080 RepID=A0A9E9LYT5_9BURK|nr:hypothetical protein [Oxalobacter vibrioformis]WAW10014.1 hypothetical protein NB640_12480 [Oxalobacter vibrioformis]